MENLELGKLYLLYGVYGTYPLNVLFGIRNPCAVSDSDAKEVMLANKTLGVFLGTLTVDALEIEYKPVLRELTYYRFLIENEILYIHSSDGATFERVIYDFDNG
jgi:hypothetical protein